MSCVDDRLVMADVEMLPISESNKFNWVEFSLESCAVVSFETCIEVIAPRVSGSSALSCVELSLEICRVVSEAKVDRLKPSS